MARSKIEWTEHTWNPLTGCSIISAGCNNCYAMKTAHRGLHDGWAGLTKKINGNIVWTGEVRRAVDSIFYAPLRRKTPTLYFTNSMSDLFHENVSAEIVLEIIQVMRQCPQHIFQILTKRPENAENFLRARQISLPNNVWLGTSVEDNRVTPRIDALRRIPAEVRFLSCEPLIGPVGQVDLTGIDWVIVGGEKLIMTAKAKHRPMRPEWVRELRDQCLNAGVAFFFKQWGHQPPQPGDSTSPATFDGVEWKQFPVASALHDASNETPPTTAEVKALLAKPRMRVKAICRKQAESATYLEQPTTATKPRIRVKAGRSESAGTPKSSLPLEGGGQKSLTWLIRPIILHFLSDGQARQVVELREMAARTLGIPTTNADFINDFAWALVELQKRRGGGDYQAGAAIKKVDSRLRLYRIQPGHEQRIENPPPPRAARHREGWRHLIARERPEIDPNVSWVYVCARFHKLYRTKAYPLIERLTEGADRVHWSGHLLGFSAANSMFANICGETGMITLPFSAHIQRSMIKPIRWKRTALKRRLTLLRRPIYRMIAIRDKSMRPVTGAIRFGRSVMSLETA